MKAEHELKSDTDVIAGERRKKGPSSREKEKSRLVDFLDAGTILASIGGGTAGETAKKHHQHQRRASV